jgi:glycosyltransferase involved in cell wall biosynthesis
MASSEPEALRVSICIATCGRPAGLARLLGSLEPLLIPDDVELRVVVIDNDSSGSARSVCDDVAERQTHPIDYRIEKRRGIPFARNAALHVALASSDFVAFIDDDEVPELNWLAELLRVQREFDADVVTGPCLPEYPEKPPRWVIEGGFHERPRFATGTVRPVAFTHNALVRAAAFERLDRYFDESMERNGGDDSELFGRLYDAGCRIVWADTAVTRETIPKSRTTLRWILVRAFRIGTASSWIAVRRGDSRSKLLVHAAYCLAKGLGLTLLLPLVGRAPAAAGLRLFAAGCGRVAGAGGHLHQEYRVVHGD